MSAEINSIPKEMQTELKVLFNYYIEWLTSLIEYGQSLSEFSSLLKARDTALVFSSAIEGALLFSRAYQLENHYTVVTNTLENMLQP